MTWSDVPSVDAAKFETYLPNKSVTLLCRSATCMIQNNVLRHIGILVARVPNTILASGSLVQCCCTVVTSAKL
jgi:hypothetical protein